MNENTIKIKLDTFTYHKQKHEKIPDNILEKVQYYKKTYSCFNSLYDPKMIWEKKKFMSKEDRPVKNRFHIIIPDFTDDGQNKREITALLNKLTDKNKDVIGKNLKHIIQNNPDNEEYFNLIWTYTKTTDSELYLDILKFYNMDFFNRNVEQFWNKYITDKEWMPPSFIFKNDLLHLNDEYNMYCDYIKWKKETHNLNIAWIKLGKNIDIVLNDIFEFLLLYINDQTEHITYKYVIDIFLEQIDKILKYHKNMDIIDKFRALDINRFESSSKFLIYSIIEKK